MAKINLNKWFVPVVSYITAVMFLAAKEYILGCAWIAIGSAFFPKKREGESVEEADK